MHDLLSAGHADLRDCLRPKKELPDAAFTFSFSLYLLKSHFRESYKSATATKMEILHLWDDFLNWSYLWEWSKNGATALQKYWWTLFWTVFLFPAHCDCRAHFIIYSVIRRWGKKQMVLKHLSWKCKINIWISNFWETFRPTQQLYCRWSSSFSCVHILEIIKMKSGSLSLKTWIINIWTSACNVLISTD